MKSLRRYSSIGLSTIAALLLLLFIGGCATTIVDPGATPLNAGELLAETTVEGTFDAADAKAIDSVTYYSVLATVTFKSGQRNINLIIPKQASVPYTVDVATSSIATIAYCVSPDNVSCMQFFAKAGTGSGSITITQLTPTLKGSFNGTLVLLPKIGNDTIRTVSSGEFNATF